jgi:hypothetical protein
MLDLNVSLKIIKMSIKIVKFNDGLTIHPSSTTPGWSCIRVAEETLKIVNGMPNMVQKSAIVRQKNEIIAAIVADPLLLASAHVQIIEKLESELEDNELYVPESSSYAEVLDKFSKRAGVGGPVLRKNGERIIRYTKLTDNQEDLDIIVQHDNIEEVQSWSAAQKAAAGATIPQV